MSYKRSTGSAALVKGSLVPNRPWLALVEVRSSVSLFRPVVGAAPCIRSLQFVVDLIQAPSS